MVNTLTYNQIPKYFTWDKDEKKWHPRDRRSKKVIGQMYHIVPFGDNKEKYFLKLLLLNVAGPSSYNDLLTVKGEYPNCKTYQQTCIELGLANDDDEYRYCLQDACRRSMPRVLRNLYVNILINCTVADPYGLWEEFKEKLSDDTMKTYKNTIPDEELLEYSCNQTYAMVAYLYEKEKGQPISSIKGMP